MILRVIKHLFTSRSYFILFSKLQNLCAILVELWSPLWFTDQNKFPSFYWLFQHTIGVLRVTFLSYFCLLILLLYIIAWIAKYLGFLGKITKIPTIYIAYKSITINLETMWLSKTSNEIKDTNEALSVEEEELHKELKNLEKQEKERDRLFGEIMEAFESEEISNGTMIKCGQFLVNDDYNFKSDDLKINFVSEFVLSCNNIRETKAKINTKRKNIGVHETKLRSLRHKYCLTEKRSENEYANLRSLH